MKRNLKNKFLSMLLSASMIVTMTASVSATGETENTETTQLTDKIFSTTVVSQDNSNSSTYELKSEPTYTINLALTDGTEKIEKFTITDTDGQSVNSQISNTSDSVQISGLALNELYVFNSTIDDTPIRGAVETIQDCDTVVAVIDVYDFSELEAAEKVSNQRGSGSITWDYEYPDTTLDSPEDLSNGVIMRGKVDQAGDKDVYTFTTVVPGYINVKLLVPDNSNMDLTLSVYRVYSGASYRRVGYSTNSGTSDEFARAADSYTVGATYRIEVDAVSQGNDGELYYLQVENINAKAWFYQGRGKIGTTYCWNTNKLDTLKFNMLNSNNEIEEVVFTDNNNDSNISDDGMQTGCRLTAVAMIFANMQLNTVDELYDFRVSNQGLSGLEYYYNTLAPDPYVLFLANNNLSGLVTYSSNTYRFINSDNQTYTMYGNWANIIAPAFGVTYSKLPTGYGNYYNFSESTGYNSLISELNSIDEEIITNGVMLNFTSHAVVVVKEGTSYFVYDPGQADTYYNYPLADYFNSSSISYDYTDIKSIMYFE